MKHSLNREELIEQLKELAAQELPTYLANHIGAMCYAPSMIDSFSATCQHCHRPLVYQAFRNDEEKLNSIISEIKDLGYDVTFEIICGSCALKAKEEAEFFDLPFTSEDDICEENAYHLFCFKTKSDKDYHQAITDMESLYDYQAVLAFLKGESYFEDSYDRYHSIMDEQDTIKRMTGIGIKENDSNEE